MGQRILIAEDDYDLRVIVSDFLTTSGYSVMAVPNGSDALDVMPALQPQLLILDFSMPKMDGWSVLAQLRARAETQDLPIIAFTAHALSEDQEKARLAGCDGFITKPFNPNDLLNEIRRLLPPAA